MCLAPIKIKNTNAGSRNPLTLALFKDTTHEYMEVPCGHCEQCIAARQNSFVQRIQAESEYNHLFFATLTYDNDHLPRLSIEVPVVRKPDDPQLALSLDESTPHDSCDAPSNLVPIDICESRDSDEFLSLAAMCPPEDDAELIAAREAGDAKRMKEIIDARKQAQIDSHTVGECLDDAIEYETISFAYADIHDVQLLVKNVRDNNPLDGRCIRYVCVSELGKQNGRPHFHILWLVEKRPEDFTPDGQPIKAQIRTLEARLRTCVKKYWAKNIGTRKEPIYEPRFKYARRWSFGKMYTNFDLHWVDPSATAEQTSNVAYYVSKYMMKGSDRDARRQQFLRLNLQEDEYLEVWKTIKCRMTCSKGLGLDARFITTEHTEEVVQYKPLYQVAQELNTLMQDDDLPDPDTVSAVLSRSHRVIRKRVLIPNFDLAEKIRRDLTADVGTAPGPIYIDPQGNHRPLSHYYQRYSFIYCAADAITILHNYRGPEPEPPTKEDYDEAEKRVARRRRIVDLNSPFDNVSTVDMPEDDPTLKTYIY